MGTDWVVDASVAVKLLVAEPDSEPARALLDQAARAGRLLAPSLIRYEVGNAISKRGAPAGLDGLIVKALSMVERMEPVDVAEHYGPLSYYDAAYLALALEQKAGLLTTDEKLRKAAKNRGVPVGP